MSVITGREVPLSASQTGNGDSTNIALRNRHQVGDPGAIVITNVAGATPTVTVQILGSVDGSAWYKIPYALVATPETIAVADITITAAVTTTYLLVIGHAWRYLKLNYSANTNETLTATAFI